MPKTLLLADDSVVIQKLVGLSFANEDVKLVTTDNGDDALTRAREISPDLILADVVMPGRNGYELCEAIKADPQLSHTPVLLLTGTFEAFDEDRARQVGSDGHITKPFEAQGLVDRVIDLLARERPTPAAEPAAENARAAAEIGSDDTYDFFDDATDLAQPMSDAAQPSDDVFEFGSPEFVPLAGDDDPLSGADFDATLDTDLDAAPESNPPISLSMEPSIPLAIPSIETTDSAEPILADATIVAEEAPLAVREPASTDDDLFARLADAELPPELPSFDAAAAASGSPLPPASTDPAPGDDRFEFGFDGPSSTAPPEAATTIMQAPVIPEGPGEPNAESLVAEAVMVSDGLAPVANAAVEPVAAATVLADEVAPSVEPVAIEAPSSDYDVSISDVGDASISASPVPDPVLTATALSDDSASEPLSIPVATGPDLSGMMRDRIHETLEKVAWEAFADLSDAIVRQVLERVESTIWEIVPQMAETLIQEEIRKMKGEAE